MATGMELLRRWQQQQHPPKKSLAAVDPACLDETQAPTAEGVEFADLEPPELLRLHSTSDACWIVIDGRVLDVTSYLGRHPGGVESISRLAGRDATRAFAAARHSQAAIWQCRDYDIGAVHDAVQLRKAAVVTARHRERIRKLEKWLER